MTDLAPILTDLTALVEEFTADAAIKAGARHSASDTRMIQEIAEAAAGILDHAIGLGATAPEVEGAEEEEEPDEGADLPPAALKMVYDDPLAYATHECGDIMGASAALQTLAQLAMSELGENNPGEGTLAKVTGAMRLLLDYISKEIDVIGNGGMKSVNYDQAAQLVRDAWCQANPGENGGPCSSWPQAVYDNAIIISERGVLWYVPYQKGDNQVIFADRGGWKEARQIYVTADGTEIKAIAKRDDVDPKADPPSATKDGADYAVKMLGNDEVFGPAIWLNGSPDTHDLSRERDFFTKSTDFWLDHWDRRPMLWHHGQNEGDILTEMQRGGAGSDEIKAMREAFAYLHENPVIGIWTKATADPIAVWLHGQLSKAHRYRSAIKELVARGLIKISTDSAPHLVVREPRPNNTHEVKRWPIVAGSLTVSAAEPRLFDVQAVKAWYDEAGIPMPGEVAEAAAETKASEERQRALLLEIGLLELGIPA